MSVGTTLRPEVEWDECSRACGGGNTHIRNMGSSGSTSLMKRNILILAPEGLNTVKMGRLRYFERARLCTRTQCWDSQSTVPSKYCS